MFYGNQRIETMNGYEKRAETKKRKIKREASKLFNKYGFNKVTLDEIASYANVSRVTIYKYFGDKEALLTEILKELANETTDTIGEIIDSDRSFLIKFKEITDLKIDITDITNNSFIGETITQGGELGGVVSPELAQRIDEMIRKLINQGKSENIIRSELSHKTILNYFKIMRGGLKQLQQSEDPLIRDQEQLSILMNLFMNGLK